MTLDNLEQVERSLIWLGFCVVVLVVAFVAAARLVSRVNDDRNPTVVGGLLLTKGGGGLSSIPLFEYVGDVATKSAVLGFFARAGEGEVRARLLLSNVIVGKCDVQGASVIAEPHDLGIDTAFYSSHQGHQRHIYAIDLTIAPHAYARVTCNITDPPERETYATRRIAFSPPLNNDMLVKAQEGGFVPIWPLDASIQRVTESTGFTTSGGQRVDDSTIAATYEAYRLTPTDPILRAFWTDERARSWQTFWLLFWAALAGLGFAMLLEAVRPFIEILLPTPPR